MSLATTLSVLDVARGRQQSIDLVRSRSTASRLRHRLGRGEPVSVGRELYWPIAVIHASAAGTFWGRPWTDRVLGAVDLVTGRIGLVDLDLPTTERVEAAPEACVAARLGQQRAEAAWHEYFRDYIDRRRKPMRPPTLTVDRIDRLWLPNHVASVGARTYLVDPLVGRVEELSCFPHVQQMLMKGDHPGPVPSS